MRRQSFSALFFINKAKLQKNGEAPIVLRISVGGIRAESNIRRSVQPELWNQKTEMSMVYPYAQAPGVNRSS